MVKVSKKRNNDKEAYRNDIFLATLCIAMSGKDKIWERELVDSMNEALQQVGFPPVYTVEEVFKKFKKLLKLASDRMALYDAATTIKCRTLLSLRFAPIKVDKYMVFLSSPPSALEVRRSWEHLRKWLGR